MSSVYLIPHNAALFSGGVQIVQIDGSFQEVYRAILKPLFLEQLKT